MNLKKKENRRRIPFRMGMVIRPAVSVLVALPAMAAAACPAPGLGGVGSAGGPGGPCGLGGPGGANGGNGQSGSDGRPNILFILCDDMGYGDLACYGQQHIDTPNLDELARCGMRFTNAYSGSPVSAPSRCALMTGQHTGHCRVRGNREYWPEHAQEGMFGSHTDYTVVGQEPYDMNHIIIPEIMKLNGYKTGMFGKWAGGYYNLDYPDTYALLPNGDTDTSKSSASSSASLPNLRGIDTYYGMICQFQAHSYFPNFLNRYDPEKFGDRYIVVDTLKQNILHEAVNTGSRDYEQRTQYSSDLIHRYALEWLDRQTGDAPFMGILTYTLPHAELWQPQDELVEKYRKRFGDDEVSFEGQFGSWYYRNDDSHAQFAAMIERLDRQVGEIVALLKAKGLYDNTLIIFTSDNGPHEEGGADPDWFLNRDGGLRGHKRSCYEGGIRVPFIACWPGHVAAGSVNDHQLAFYDVLPTLCDILGTTPATYLPQNSISNQTCTSNCTSTNKHNSPSHTKCNSNNTGSGKCYRNCDNYNSSISNGSSISGGNSGGQGQNGCNTDCDNRENNSMPDSGRYGSGFDGISFYPTLVGRDSLQQKHEFLYWELGETRQIGLRMGDWKLVVIDGVCHLYNLATDFHEDTDLSAQRPDIVRQMTSIILREHTDNPLFPIPLPE